MSKISPEAYAYYTDVEKTGMVWEFSPMTLVTRAYQDGSDSAAEKIQKLEVALNKANQCIYCAIQSYPELADRIGEQDWTKE